MTELRSMTGLAGADQEDQGDLTDDTATNRNTSREKSTGSIRLNKLSGNILSLFPRIEFPETLRHSVYLKCLQR